MSSRTTLMTWIFFAPASLSVTVNSVCSSAAGAAAPPAPPAAGAAAPVAMVQGGGGAAPVEAEVEKDSFDVVLEADGGKKIQVIKVVRELTGLGLKEAKDAVEAAPKAILEGVNQEKADAAKAKLEGEGAKVTLK